MIIFSMKQNQLPTYLHQRISKTSVYNQIITEADRNKKGLSQKAKT